jgi:hypothetical protein
MQSPPHPAATALPPGIGDHYVVRLSAALAALCGHQENEEVLYHEDEVLPKLRAGAYTRPLFSST